MGNNIYENEIILSQLKSLDVCQLDIKDSIALSKRVMNADGEVNSLK